VGGVGWIGVENGKGVWDVAGFVSMSSKPHSTNSVLVPMCISRYEHLGYSFL
jgi:hypothetical protein